MSRHFSHNLWLYFTKRTSERGGKYPPLSEVDIFKRKTGGNPKKSATVAPANYVLVSLLLPEQKALLGEFWNKASIKYFTQVDELKSIHDNMNIPTTEQTLISNGLTMIIISCVALSSNNINKKELLKYFKTHFNLEASSTIPKITYNSEKVTFEEYLKLLERYEFLHKRVEKSDENELVEYSLARRAKVEFPFESLFQFVAKMYGYTTDEQKEELKKQIQLSIGRAYS